MLGTDWVKKKLTTLAVGYLENQVEQRVQPHLDKVNNWVTSHTGEESNLSVQTIRQGVQDGTLLQQGQDTIVNTLTSQAQKKLDRVGLKNADKVIEKTGIGRGLLDKAGVKSIQELEEKIGERIVKEGTEKGAKVFGEKGAKFMAEKGAKFFLKKAARCIPGVGLLTGGAIEAYEYCQERKDMRERYGEQTSAWLKTQGIDVAPEDIKFKHLKQYAEQNPVIRKQINEMTTDALARTAAGGLGFIGVAAEIGYDSVDMIVGSRAAHEVMDDMAEKQQTGQPVTREDVLEMVDSAFSGEKGKTTKKLSKEEKAAFEAVADKYAQQLNDSTLSAYDMLSEVGDGKFHQYASTQHEIEQIRSTMASNMNSTLNDAREVQYDVSLPEVLADQQDGPQTQLSTQEQFQQALRSLDNVDLTIDMSGLEEYFVATISTAMNRSPSANRMSM